MNKVTGSILIIIFSISFISCGNSESQNQPENHPPISTSTHGLELNNGKLWKANRETTEGVESMIEIMSSFQKTNDLEAYSELTEKLKNEFSLIFKNCTMTGAAHDQLHNFLIPIKDLLTTLSSSNISECQESYDQLFTQLKLYHNYFD
jgi:hypothetical protein